MKYFFFFLIIAINTNAQWQSIDIQTKKDLNHVFFLDEINGWIGGSDGALFKTTDGGNNWIDISPADFGTVQDVKFTSSSVGWIAAQKNNDSTSVYKTTDAGATWIPQPIYKRMNSLYFIDESLGWAAGDHGYIYKTSDGGNTWSSNAPTNYFFWKILFKDENTGVVCGTEKAFHTTNAGLTWSEVSLSPGEIHNDLSFSGGRYYMISIRDGESKWRRSDNGGLSFTSGSRIQTYLNGIHFVNSDTGWVCGENGTILYSENRGLTRTEQASGTTNNLSDIFFINESKGWIVGSGGTLLFTNNAGGITSIEDEENIVTQFSLNQNYPNPFNPSTKISFAIPNNAYVSLKVYNSLGEEVTVLLNEEFNAGLHEVDYNASGLPSGIYYYKITAGNFSETKKMILIK